MSEERDVLSFTDDEENDEFEEEGHLLEKHGTLSKWTNYLHGWQDRYIVLKDGTFSYFKSVTETAYGCRGAVSLNRACVTDFFTREETDDDEPEKDNEIKDLEFQMIHELNQLQKITIRSQNLTMHQINLLKVILCSGLYPQVAISDECNTFKPNSEQVFHTKYKSFLLLHPTSVFFNQPELLQLPDTIDTTEKIVGHKGIMSSKHELLAYVSILETNKPYLINTMRVPAMETLLLFCNSLDTNGNCTRMVCDSWLELTFAKAEEGQEVLLSAIHLRSIWKNLITSRFQEKINPSKEDLVRNVQDGRIIEDGLAKKLAEFLNKNIVYSIRRIMTAELKNIYVGPLMNEPNIEFQRKLIKSTENHHPPHPIKGGVIVTDFIVFNCLKNNNIVSVHEQQMDSLQKPQLWTCPKCNKSLSCSFLEKQQHEASCDSTTEIPGIVHKEENKPSQHHHFFCTDCQKEFIFSNTEILKHKRIHI